MFSARQNFEKNAHLKSETHMKALILILSFLFIQSAFAIDNYTCRPYHWTTRVRLQLNKEIGLKNGKMMVNMDSCSITESDRYSDICHVGDNTVMISIDPKLPSVLVLKNGNIYKMECLDPEQQEQQEQQQQQQQQGEGPGHGGSTIKG
jgi:hypothetical protein